MKSRQVQRHSILVVTAVVVMLVIPPLVHAEPVIHKFQYWGTLKNPVEKLVFYNGWTNGFFVARGQSGLEFADCLNKIDYEQAVAMIDKQYKDHPESWSRPLTEQILQALTIGGGPCEGKNPLAADSK